ncbi:MAG: hypothetical protein QM715_20215 [Nibricoccus sp.]
MVGESLLPLEAAEIIYEKPATGVVQEISFGLDRGNTLWVRFHDKGDVVGWIGKFACGFSPTMRVTKAAEPDRFLVLAGGAAYLVDATRRTVLNQYVATYAEDIAFDPKKNQFIAGDVRLRIVENGREIWTSRRISVEGIYNMKVTDRVLSGIAVVGTGGEEEPFAFDLDKREFLRGPDFSSWDVPSEPKKPKAWWKFWQ